LDSVTIISILERASYFSQKIQNKEPFNKTLQDKVIANLFFEHSTRTRFSFEVAAKRLGANVLNFDAESSSIAKGETLYDTLKAFEALGIDVGIIRHSDDSYIESLKEKHRFSIINAGAGKFEHPSQSLLDLYTIQAEFKTLENLTITICGDIANSRVAKSNINALKKFNSNIILSGPKELLPKEDDLDDHCKIMNIDDAIKRSDVVMFLRVQHERHSLYDLDTTSYNKDYGLNAQRMNFLKPDAIIMHPGPFNRDVEISSELVEHRQSRIFKQKENGVYTRMAILEWILS
jgi:aspartate carbamoyltransferase catalytic subunit